MGQFYRGAIKITDFAIQFWIIADTFDFGVMGNGGDRLATINRNILRCGFLESLTRQGYQRCSFINTRSNPSSLEAKTTVSVAPDRSSSIIEATLIPCVSIR